MYEGFLQHDAQEVLQCILGYMQEACDTIRKEQQLHPVASNTEIKLENSVHPQSTCAASDCNPISEEENQVSGKRKSDTEVGNVKKKPKPSKSKKAEDSKEEARSQPLTRSKRRSSSNVVSDSMKSKEGEAPAQDKEIKKLHKEEEERASDSEGKGKKASKEAPDGKAKKKAGLRWLRPSGKQPSIFSKFRSVGKLSCSTPKNPDRVEQQQEEDEDGLKSSEEKTGEKTGQESPAEKLAEHKKAVQLQGGSRLLLQLWQCCRLF